MIYEICGMYRKKIFHEGPNRKSEGKLGIMPSLRYNLGSGLGMGLVATFSVQNQTKNHKGN